MAKLGVEGTKRFAEDLEIASPQGKVLRKSRNGLTKYYSAYSLRGVRYNIGDTALFISNGFPFKPYVGIIKEIMQKGRTRESNPTLKLNVQWFYRPEESEKEGGVYWTPEDPRQLFYSFHTDIVDVSSVLHKCAVWLVPSSRVYPDSILHPGFVIQKVYDPIEKKIYAIESSEFSLRHSEIRKLLKESQEVWGTLPFINPCEEDRRKLPELQFVSSQLKRLRRSDVGEEASKKDVSLKDVEREIDSRKEGSWKRQQRDVEEIKHLDIKKQPTKKKSWKQPVSRGAQEAVSTEYTKEDSRKQLLILAEAAEKILQPSFKAAGKAGNRESLNLVIEASGGRRSSDSWPEVFPEAILQSCEKGNRASETRKGVAQQAQATGLSCLAGRAEFEERIRSSAESARHKLSCRCGSSWYSNSDCMAGFLDTMELVEPHREGDETEADSGVELGDGDVWL